MIRGTGLYCLLSGLNNCWHRYGQGKNEQVKKVFWTLFVAMAGAGAGSCCGSGDSSSGC
ncbi:MAG: hypothetical protein LUQ04_09460 [Methanoregula sp.]|nr:hypothetical protein [Methanoregula sp.]